MVYKTVSCGRSLLSLHVFAAIQIRVHTLFVFFVTRFLHLITFMNGGQGLFKHATRTTLERIGPQFR